MPVKVLTNVARLAAVVWLLTLNASVVADEAAFGVVNRAVDIARELSHSDNPYDQILGAGILADIGDLDALALLEEYAVGSDIVFQRSAIDTLIGIQHPNGIDLIYRLASRDPSFVRFLAQSLATNPRDDMGDFLVSLLQDAKPQVKQYAIQALVHIKDAPQAVDVVNALLDSNEILLTTKAYACYYLAQHGHADEIEDRLHEIVAKGDLNQREVAAVAFRHVTTESGKEALRRLQKSRDARVSLAAIASYAALGDEEAERELINIIARGKSLNAEVGASAIRRLPPKMAHRLSLELFALNLRPDPGSRLLESWRSIDWNAADIYEWGLTSKHVDVQMQALWLIGYREDRDMVERVATFLTSKDARLRGMAAWAIVHIAPEEYVPGTKV